MRSAHAAATSHATQAKRAKGSVRQANPATNKKPGRRRDGEEKERMARSKCIKYWLVAQWPHARFAGIDGVPEHPQVGLGEERGVPPWSREVALVDDVVHWWSGMRCSAGAPHETTWALHPPGPRGTLPAASKAKSQRMDNVTPDSRRQHA